MDAIETVFSVFKEHISHSLRVNGSHTFTRAEYSQDRFILTSLMRYEHDKEYWVNVGTMSGHKQVEARRILEETKESFEAFLDKSGEVWPGLALCWPDISIELSVRGEEWLFLSRFGTMKMHHTPLESAAFLSIWRNFLQKMKGYAGSGPVVSFDVVQSLKTETFLAVNSVDALVRYAVIAGFNGDPEQARSIVFSNSYAVPSNQIQSDIEAAVMILRGSSKE